MQILSRLETSKLLNPQQGKFVDSFFSHNLAVQAAFLACPTFCSHIVCIQKAVPTQLEDKPSLSADKVQCQWLPHPLFISLCLLGCQRLLATAGRWIVLHHSTFSWCTKWHWETLRLSQTDLSSSALCNPVRNTKVCVFEDVSYKHSQEVSNLWRIAVADLLRMHEDPSCVCDVPASVNFHFFRI